jgi:hypothetical protein
LKSLDIFTLDHLPLGILCELLPGIDWARVSAVPEKEKKLLTSDDIKCNTLTYDKKVRCKNESRKKDIRNRNYCKSE